MGHHIVFESPLDYGRMAELVDAHALGACGETRGGSSPLPPIKLNLAAIIQLVECHLAKVDAMGSNPIRRFEFFKNGLSEAS